MANSSDETKALIIKQFIEKQAAEKPAAPSVEGQESALKCRCGGSLVYQGIPFPRPLMGRYQCTACRRVTGAMSAIAENVFRVEPLPDGAAPIYFSPPSDDD